MRILVTGGNGFVGGFIARHLALTHAVLTPSSKELDLTNLEQVNNWFSSNEVDAVVHCALTGREVLFSTDPKYLSDSLLMFRNLWLNRKKYSRLINLGTAYEFDLSVSNDNIKEDDVINHLPTTSYGYAKNLVARIIKETPSFYNLRLFGVFHETESPTRFFSKVRYNPEIVINNDVYLDYIYLLDIFPMIDCILDGNAQHRDINMVYPHKYQLSNLAEVLCHYADLPITKIKINNPSGNNLTGDNLRLSSYGFNLIGLEQGLRNYK